MIKLLTLLTALAQGGPSPTPIQNVVTYTVSPDGGALNYYVDVRGSDANTCTSPFTDGGKRGPCRQPQAAVNKIPKFINHNVNVVIDAGSYEPVVIEGFFTKADTSLSLIGPPVPLWITFTPDAGSATGTITSYAGTAFPTMATVTDDLQSWHPRTDTYSFEVIRGRFFCMTSGLQTNSVRVIGDTSPTSLSFPRAFVGNGPDAGDAYRLCTPAALIVNSDGGFTDSAVAFGANSGNFNVTDLEIVSTSGASPMATRGRQVISATQRLGGASTIGFTRVRFQGEALSQASQTGIGSTTLVFTDSSFAGRLDQSNHSSNLNVISAGGSTSTRLSLSGVYFHCQRNCLIGGDGRLGLSAVALDSENVTAGNGPVLSVGIAGGAFTGMANVWVNCISRLFAPSTNSNEEAMSLGQGNFASITTLAIDGCLTGINAGGLGPNNNFIPGATVGAAKPSATISFTNISSYQLSAGYGVRIGRGSTVDFSGATVTFTGVNDGGRDYAFWNEASYTEAQVQALPDKFQCVGNACVYR